MSKSRFFVVLKLLVPQICHGDLRVFHTWILRGKGVVGWAREMARGGKIGVEWSRGLGFEGN
jgi:hypothetical protein